MPVRTLLRLCGRTVVQASDNHALSRKFKSTGHAGADQIDSHRSAVQLDGRLVRATRVELELLTLVAGTGDQAAELGFHCASVRVVWQCCPASAGTEAEQSAALYGPWRLAGLLNVNELQEGQLWSSLDVLPELPALLGLDMRKRGWRLAAA
jgi:hypothetical protein